MYKRQGRKCPGGFHLPLISGDDDPPGTLGLQVEPENRGLETLRSMIETREKTFFETVAEYFRSS